MVIELSCHIPTLSIMSLFYQLMPVVHELTTSLLSTASLLYLFLSVLYSYVIVISPISRLYDSFFHHLCFDHSFLRYLFACPFSSLGYLEMECICRYLAVRCLTMVLQRSASSSSSSTEELTLDDMTFIVTPAGIEE